MRLFTTVFPLVLVISGVAGRAIHKFGHPAHKPRHNNLLVDVCAFVSTDFNVGSTAFGHLDSCLCLSSAASFVESLNSTLVGRASSAVVEQRLQSVIKTAPNRRTCSRPANAIPQCTRLNPCGWSCPAGFASGMFGCVPAPGHCPSCTTPKPPTAPPCASCNPPKPLNPPPCVACTSPKPTTLPPCTICNPPKPPAPCPSSPSKRSSDIRVESTLRADVSSKCPSPRQACAANHGYDCLDVSTSLTNCGGCTKPLFDDQPRGVDCTSLDGAEVVQCKLGTCEVGKCGDGYKVHRDGSSCTKFDVDVKSQLSSSTRSSIIATNSSTGAAVGVLESTAETTVASDNDAIAGRHLEDWKRTDAATSAAADLLADLLGQHAGLFTESFTETILRRRQLKDHMYAPVIADASSAFTTVSDVSLGDSGNEVKTVVESSASSIVNFERGNMADWKRQLLRGSSTLVAAADAKLSELHVDTVTETSALLKANPVSNAVDSYIIAGLVDHTVIGRDVAETELDGYTDVELVSDNIADTVVVDSVLVSDIEAAAVASAVTEYEVDSSVY